MISEHNIRYRWQWRGSRWLGCLLICLQPIDTDISVFFQEQRKFGKNLIILLSKYLLKFQVAI